MKRLISILILIYSSTVMSFSQINESDILGTWKVLKKQGHGMTHYDSEFKTDFSPYYEVNKQDTTITNLISFNENNQFDFKKGNKNFRRPYKIKKDELIIGNRSYQVNLIKPDSLIIIDISSKNKIIYYCKRTNLDFRLADEYITILEKYPTDQIKIKGTLHYGHKDGVWEEWYMSGQKKSIKEYKEGIPTGKWKMWDKNGKTIEYYKIKGEKNVLQQPI